jgi:hypothetical protein
LPGSPRPGACILSLVVDESAARATTGRQNTAGQSAVINEKRLNRCIEVPPGRSSIGGRAGWYVKAGGSGL